jgi:hypothetical protein
VWDSPLPLWLWLSFDAKGRQVASLASLGRFLPCGPAGFVARRLASTASASASAAAVAASNSAAAAAASAATAAASATSTRALLLGRAPAPPLPPPYLFTHPLSIGGLAAGRHRLILLLFGDGSDVASDAGAGGEAAAWLVAHLGLKPAGEGLWTEA